VIRAVRDVFLDRTVEQHGLLRDQPNVFAQMSDVRRPDVAVVDFLRG